MRNAPAVRKCWANRFVKKKNVAQQNRHERAKKQPPRVRAWPLCEGEPKSFTAATSTTNQIGSKSTVGHSARPRVPNLQAVCFPIGTVRERECLNHQHEPNLAVVRDALYGRKLSLLSGVHVCTRSNTSSNAQTSLNHDTPVSPVRLDTRSTKQHRKSVIH